VSHAAAVTWAMQALSGLSVPVVQTAPLNADGAAVGQVIVAPADLVESAGFQGGQCYRSVAQVQATATAGGDTQPYVDALDDLSDQIVAGFYAAGALQVTSSTQRTSTEAGPRWMRSMTATVQTTTTPD